jgi:hypothetical protein
MVADVDAPRRPAARRRAAARGSWQDSGRRGRGSGAPAPPSCCRRAPGRQACRPAVAIAVGRRAARGQAEARGDWPPTSSSCLAAARSRHSAADERLRSLSATGSSSGSPTRAALADGRDGLVTVTVATVAGVLTVSISTGVDRC